MQGNKKTRGQENKGTRRRDKTSVGELSLIPPRSIVNYSLKNASAQLWTVNYELLTILVSEQDVVDCSDIDGCDETVAVHIAGGEIGSVAIEQIVVDSSDVDGCHLAVAVNVARHSTGKGLHYPAEQLRQCIMHNCFFKTIKDKTIILPCP